MLSTEHIVREVKKFSSFAEAEESDRQFYRGLTPDERLQILFELVRRGQDEAEPRLERVCRIVKR